MRITRKSVASAAAAGAALVAVVGLSSAGADPHRVAGDRTAQVRADIVDGPARNVILFIGDGMGDSEITIARNYAKGAAGELSMDALPMTGSYTTYAVSPNSAVPDYVTDSAASGTAWATGVKTYNNAVGVDAYGVAHENIIEAAKKNGLKTGNITTSEIQDATPAVEGAHVALRSCYGPTRTTANCPADAKENGGRGSISEQLLDTRADLTLGGGSTSFDETATAGAFAGQTLLAQAQARGFAVVNDNAALGAVGDLSKPVLGLFAPGNMPTVWTGPQATPGGITATCAPNPALSAAAPTLPQMTQKSIELLDAASRPTDKGFFLQVEGASIDKQDHAANPCAQVGETVQLDDSVKIAQDYAAAHPDTMIIVTADHGHTSQIISNGAAATSPGATATLTTADNAPMTVNYGTAPVTGSQEHTGTQVRIAASGPYAANVTGLTDQTDLNTTIIDALQLARDLPQPPATVRINEVESSGGSPGDWIELKNTGPQALDLSGFVLRDSDDTHNYALPAGTTISAGGYLVVEESALGFGLGGADSVRLLAADTTLVDAYSWTAHAATSYGRCPDGTGDFATTAAVTKNAANTCTTPQPPAAAAPWPGGQDVAVADPAGVLGGNMSGLQYEGSGTAAPGTLWAVKNGPSTLYRLSWNGTAWAPDTLADWSAGKALRYPDGTGDPDAEGVTFTGAGPLAGVYVSTERDNAVNGVSRLSVLRFDPAAAGSTISAAQEWDLTADLPAVAPNSGLEAISWVPDSYLSAGGLLDQSTGGAYDPAEYPGHGDGLFLVGLEGNGSVYAYALNTDGTFARVAAFASGFPTIMELEYEPDADRLWAVCDDTCQGRTATLEIAGAGTDQGRFTVTQTFERPTGLPDVNNEGFAVTPDQECVNGLKPVFWTDDANTDDHALRVGTISCAATGPAGGAGNGSGSSPAVHPASQIQPRTLALTGASIAYWTMIASLSLMLGAALVLISRKHHARRVVARSC